MFGPLTVVLAAYSGSPAVSPKATDGAGDAALATVVDPAQSWQEPRMPVDCRVTGSSCSRRRAGEAPSKQR